MVVRTMVVMEALAALAVAVVEVVPLVWVEPEIHPPRPHPKVTTVQIKTVMVLVAEAVPVA